jgi:zinc/manganese transport system permease protein
MSADLLFDPLFRIPFFTGLILAALLSFLGAYARLRAEWLAAFGLAQVAAAGGVVALLLGLPPPPVALALTVATGALKGRLVKAGNDSYALLILIGWSATFLLAASGRRGEDLGHALMDGQLYFVTWEYLVTAIVVVAAGFGLMSWLSRPLLLTRFFPDYFKANGVSEWRYFLVYDLLVAATLAVAATAVGVIATFGLVFAPAWLAFKVAEGWTRTLLWCMGVGVTSYTLSFAIALLADQPFGPVMIGVLVLVCLFLRLALRLPPRATNGLPQPATVYEEDLAEPQA